ncbi:hypothetical protein [Caballeronia udeis]|uniref:hypothetical protein n=1 Tax=Caballeronia udeis TaxID=1232866 RepID=UPI0012E90E79|nr:hypothetical protein [Caballeronia udeis]
MTTAGARSSHRKICPIDHENRADEARRVQGIKAGIKAGIDAGIEVDAQSALEARFSFSGERRPALMGYLPGMEPGWKSRLKHIRMQRSTTG